MTYEELENKYNRFVERVRRLRGWQREWEKYHASTDKQVKRMLEREVDNLIKEETDLQKRKQKELF